MNYRQEMQKGIVLSTNSSQLSLGIGDVDDEVHHLLDGDDAVAVRVRQSQDLLRDAPANGRGHFKIPRLMVNFSNVYLELRMRW